MIHNARSNNFVDVQQAGMINKYKGVKQKLLKTNPAVWLSKKCTVNWHLSTDILKQKGITDKVQNTKFAATIFRLNKEIKFLYKFVHLLWL